MSACFLSACGSNVSPESPLYPFRQLEQAAAEQNATLARQAVDVDKFAQNVFESIAEIGLEESPASDEEKKTKKFLELRQAMLDWVHPMMIGDIKAAFDTFFGVSTDKGLSYFQSAMGYVHFHDILSRASLVSRNATESLVACTGSNTAYEVPVLAELLVEKHGDTWRITGIANMAEVLKAHRRNEMLLARSKAMAQWEAEMRQWEKEVAEIREANARCARAMNKAFVIVEAYKDQGRINGVPSSRPLLILKNTSGKPVRLIEVSATAKMKSTGYSMFLGRKQVKWKMPVNATTGCELDRIDIDPADEASMAFVQAPIEDVEMHLSVERIIFGDGTEYAFQKEPIRPEKPQK